MNTLTIEEVVDTFSDCLPEWQRETNLIWLTQLHSLLSEGGIWVSPELGTVYSKQGDGFVPLSMDHTAMVRPPHE